MNIKQCNGKCACHLYKLEGTAYGKHNIHRCWRFKQNQEKRTPEEEINFALKATQKEAVVGVKGHSIFAKLLYPFDIKCYRGILSLLCFMLLINTLLPYAGKMKYWDKNKSQKSYYQNDPEKEKPGQKRLEILGGVLPRVNQVGIQISESKWRHHRKIVPPALDIFRARYFTLFSVQFTSYHV